MSIENPKISIIIPTYNSAMFIEDCLDSVINQTYKNWEVIIVDQMSTDNTLDIINKKNNKFKIIANPNVGNIASSRNIGIRNSNAKILAFLDSDDIWLPKKLELSLIYLDEYEFLYHDALILNKNNKIIHDKSYRFSIHNNPELLLHLGNPIITSSVVCKKQINNKIIKFSEDPELIAIEDYDLWTRLAFDRISFKYLKNKLCLYRHHDNNISNINFNRTPGLKKIFNRHYFKLNESSKKKAKSYFQYLLIKNPFPKKTLAVTLNENLKLLFSKLVFRKKVDCIKTIIKLILKCKSI